MGEDLTCGRCHRPSGNNTQGHYWRYCKITRTFRVFHFCCPTGCEIEERLAAEDAQATAELLRTVLDLVDELVGQLTPEDIESRLSDLLGTDGEPGALVEDVGQEVDAPPSTSGEVPPE